MFEPEELDRMKEVIRRCTLADRHLLDDLCQEVKAGLKEVRVIRPRSTTSISLVASDGGNNQLIFDPFLVQLVRVVDSYGKNLCLEAVSPSTDLDALSRAQFNSDGSPRTALGQLMFDLEVKPPVLNGLTPMIPDARTAQVQPERVSPSWVQTYRDLCEWAALYNRICHDSFATNTLIVRDGFLRAKIFQRDLFIRMMNRIQESIRRIYQVDKRQVFLVGLAKHSKVLTRYNLAINTEGMLPAGDPLYVKIPRDMEAKAYVWQEYARGLEEGDSGREAPKFVAGEMYFVRFGSRSGDPVWSVDLLPTQADKAPEIFGYLLSDAIDGFPVPFYPRCLQKAHEYAQIGGFDLEILQDQIIRSVREIVPEKSRLAIDALPFQSDVSERRFG